MDPIPRWFNSNVQQWERLKGAAREMRHAPTPAENALWQRLRNRAIAGEKFRRQHSIEGSVDHNLYFGLAHRHSPYTEKTPWPRHSVGAIPACSPMLSSENVIY